LFLLTGTYRRRNSLNQMFPVWFLELWCLTQLGWDKSTALTIQFGDMA
jgi:hypothetical protein